MRNTLCTVVAVLAALTPACTGGQVTDANGNALKNVSGQYFVEFHDEVTAANYYAGIDNSGTFTFDPYGPKTATLNNPVELPGGAYLVSVEQAHNFYSTPYAIQHFYTNSNCQDFYSGSVTEPCALYKIELLNYVGTPPLPHNVGGQYGYTVIPLTPAIYPAFSQTSNGEQFTVYASGLAPNGLAVVWAHGQPGNALLHEGTVSADASGRAGSNFQLCRAGGTTSVTLQVEDESTGLFSNAATIYPPPC